jgi:hypothetical protein
LRGHLSQISEKIPKALPPSEKEIKKKGGGSSGDKTLVAGNFNLLKAV